MSYDSNLPISQLNPLPGALTSQDLMAISQQRPEGWETFNVTVSKFVDLVISGMNDGSVFLKKVNLIENSGLKGAGTVPDALGVDFDYLNTLYATKEQQAGNVSKTTRVIAGAGLGGGGALDQDRTISLGAPSSLGANTINQATGQTHTHEVDKASTTVAGLVKLNDTVTSQSTTEAATARVAYDLYTTKADKSITFSAGSGLTGGGNLQTSRTISLGLPSTITASTPNQVSGETHSHAIDKASTTVAGVVKLYDGLNSTSTTEAATASTVKTLNDGKVDKGLAISTAYGLAGGGNLWNNLNISIDWGVLDARYASAGAVNSYVPQTRVVSAGNGLVGGGALNNNVSLSVNFGTAANTAAMGNDARINNGQSAYNWGNHAGAGYMKEVRGDLTYILGAGTQNSPLFLNLPPLDERYFSKAGGRINGEVVINGNITANNLDAGVGIGFRKGFDISTYGGGENERPWGRFVNTEYYNNSPNAIFVAITYRLIDEEQVAIFYVNGVAMGGPYYGQQASGSGSWRIPINFIVPPRSTYKLTGRADRLHIWSEAR